MKAINNDNFGKASREINPSPVAQLDPKKLEALKKLYPNKITNSYSTSSSRYNTRSTSRSQPASQNMSQSSLDTPNIDDTHDTKDHHSNHTPLHLRNNTVKSINVEFEKLAQTDKNPLSVSYLQKVKATCPAAESTDCLKRLFNTKVQGRLFISPNSLD